MSASTRESLDLRRAERKCGVCGVSTPRDSVSCAACGAEYPDHEDMVALLEGVDGAAELLGWTPETEDPELLRYHPGAILDRAPEFRRVADELGVDLATAAFHWAEALVDADWIARARAGAAPDTPAARAMGRVAEELSERAIRDAEAAEARVRRVRAAITLGSVAVLVAVLALAARLIL